MDELDLSFVDDLSVDDLLNVGPDDVDGLELSDGGPPLHEFEELFFGTAATAAAGGVGSCGELQQRNIPNYYSNNNNYVPYGQNNMDYNNMNLQLEHPSYGVSGAAGAPSPLPPYHHVHPHHAHTPSPPPLLFRSHDYESHRYHNHNHNNCYSMDTFHPHHAHQHAQYYPRVEHTQQEQSRTITPVHVESSSTTKQEEGNANNSSILIKEEKEKDHNDNKNNVLVPTADESRESRRQRIQKMVDNKRGLYQRRMNTYIASSSQNNANGNANTNAVTNSHYYYLMSPEATASAVSAALDISPSQIHDEDVANIAFGLVKNLAQANVQQAQKVQAQQAEEKKTSTSAKAKAKATEDKPKGKGKARGRSRSIARKKNTKSSKETKAKENQDTTKATTATSTKKKKKESVHDMELPEGNDPESRKMRRLIRNRLSAQLHRERKREALDSLRAEVEERDEKIKVLEQELKEVSFSFSKSTNYLYHCMMCTNLSLLLIQNTHKTNRNVSRLVPWNQRWIV